MKMLLKSPRFWVYLQKKKRTPFYWASKLRRTIRKWLQPLDFGYTSKKEEHHYLVLKMKNAMKMLLNSLDFGYFQKKKNTIFVCHRRKKNFGTKFCHHFWAHQQKMENPYSWITGRRKTTKYSKSGNPLDKPTKTLYFRVTTRSKPMFSRTFLSLPPINSLRITTKK